MLPGSNHPISDKAGLLLVLISSLLLGIWGVVHTIALRNMLLGIGSLMGLLYWYEWVAAKPMGDKKRISNYIDYVPLCLVAFIFLWVILHYFLFSKNPQQQLDELSGTWLRALLAALLGSATGLALNRNSRYGPLLWVGMTLGFVVLFCQYVTKALQTQSILAPDFFSDYYIYWAKFNGVLIGALLMAGLIGLMIDFYRSRDGFSCSFIRANGVVGQATKTKKLLAVIFLMGYAVLGIFLSAYSFVFIFDAKTGVGISVILILFWVLIGICFGIRKIMRRKVVGFNLFASSSFIGIFVLIILFISFFAYKQAHLNPGWESLMSDTYISAQIDKYPNWMNPPVFGVPKNELGQPVRVNTYERVSWAVVGLRLIKGNPLGSGLMRSFPQQIREQISPEFNYAAYTHSAWIDLTLAYGVPWIFLACLFISMVSLKAILDPRVQFRATIISLVLVIFVLYGVGEYGFQHGVEILLYMFGFLGGLSISSHKILSTRLAKS
jgi:hypothetical protein